VDLRPKNGREPLLPLSENKRSAIVGLCGVAPTSRAKSKLPESSDGGSSSRTGGARHARDSLSRPPAAQRTWHDISRKKQILHEVAVQNSRITMYFNFWERALHLIQSRKGTLGSRHFPANGNIGVHFPPQGCGHPLTQGISFGRSSFKLLCHKATSSCQVCAD